jgi:hypothetical protein
MGVRIAVLAVVVVVGLGLFFLRPQGGGTDQSASIFPLFTNLEEQYVRKMDERLERSRKVGEEERSELPGSIDWAPDVYAAIERAKQEDKPIFLMTQVRENADPDCDV